MTTQPVNIVSLVNQSVPLHGSRGELRGKCPFHAGKTAESLVVWPDEGKWRCWAGCGGGDAIDWVRQRDGVGYRAALERLGIDAPVTPAERPIVAPEPASAPSDVWQAQAVAIAQAAIETLWSDAGAKPRAWLLGRGFTEETIWRAALGYVPADLYPARAEWGLPAKPWTEENGTHHRGLKLAIPRGITIPWYVNGDELWKLFIRTPQHTGPGGKGWPKYHQVPGGTNAIYNADTLEPHRPAMICEAAFDALAVQQAAGDLVSAVATGTTGGRSVTWLARLALCRPVLLAFDNDAGGEPPLTYWRAMLPQAVVWKPRFDDPGAMLEAGTDVRGWVQAGLEASQ